jgi:phage terminase large subunit-like protein
VRTPRQIDDHHAAADTAVAETGDGVIRGRRGCGGMRTEENAAHLAASFCRRHARDRYGGLRLGRQELDGRTDRAIRAEALWSRAHDRARLMSAEHACRCGVSLWRSIRRRARADRRTPAASSPPVWTPTAVSSCWRMRALAAAKPLDWANRAIGLFQAAAADCLVAEVNQGGDMATAVLRAVDATVPVKPVRARRGKWLRAEPVAAFYQQGRVLHAGRFPQLEDEMCDFGPNGLSENRSPDRLDALVWAVTELMPDWGAEPKIRQIG